MKRRGNSRPRPVGSEAARRFVSATDWADPAIDRRAPIVALQTWFRVGSRHERPGATGMAHLFEHLMFGQTENLPPGEFDRLVERTGGESNAATWVDWTYYRLSLPTRDLALGERLEAERMQHLVLEHTPVEAERDVVTNERRERVEDDVDGWLDEQLMAQAFTAHPYRWPTIGWMEDIRALALPEIRSFYRSGTRRTARRSCASATSTSACCSISSRATTDRFRRANYRCRPRGSSSPSRRASGSCARQNRSRPIACSSATRRRGRTSRTGACSRSSPRCSRAARRRGCIAGS
jgi:hypothetical protein